ncbi:MAG: hypothetical protein IJT59_00210 [Desulfovibrionaceae bacterium]|nr:hypothetical protein [Desulfovibrionaceae bacterium]
MPGTEITGRPTLLLLVRTGFGFGMSHCMNRLCAVLPFGLVSSLRFGTEFALY